MSTSVSDTYESVLDLDEILKVELSFNTRRGETILAMKKQTREEILDNLYYRQLQRSEQQKPLLSLYIQDTVQKRESRDQTRLTQMVCETQLENPPLALQQGKSKDKGKRNSVDNIRSVFSRRQVRVET